MFVVKARSWVQQPCRLIKSPIIAISSLLFLCSSSVAFGFVFSRTDTNEYRWVDAPGNVWIDGSCAESLGGASVYGNWVDLNGIAPNFDSIANPCDNNVIIDPAPPANNGGYVFSRTDTNEFRWVVGTGNVWIDSNCAASLGGASVFGNWGDLNNVSPLFDSISNPCTAGPGPGPNPPTVTNPAGFVFSRTDANEYRWVVGSDNVWIDAACASALGGATRSGNWLDLYNIAPNFDAIPYPNCYTEPPIVEPPIVIYEPPTNVIYGDYSAYDYGINAGDSYVYRLDSVEWVELLTISGDADLRIYGDSNLSNLICQANRGGTAVDACHFIREDCVYQGLDCHAEIRGYAGYSEFHLFAGSNEVEMPVLHGGDDRTYYLNQGESRLFSVTQANNIAVHPDYGDADISVYQNGIDVDYVCSSFASGSAVDACDLPEYSGDYQIRVNGHTNTQFRIIAQ